MAQFLQQNAAGYGQNYIGNPYAQIPMAGGYTPNHIGDPYAPPVYSPFQNAAHVDDAFGYMANMYGPAIVQGMFGQDAFLPQQFPGQAYVDQFTAARYQRHGVAAIEAANMAGNQQVARNLLGWQRFMNGGLPVTALDREHANIGAQVLNNPIFKQFAASYIGPENLEGIMFGRRGDPTAVAAATNRIGFFRADAAGHGPRMSAESLKQFSQNLYNNLYGENANLDEMHGFGGIATAEMMETLFQQGRLPQSIGALSAADRVKVLGGARRRDDRVMTDLARQFGHSELSARDASYVTATEEEQKRMLADKLPTFKTRLEDTFKEIDKFSAGDRRAMSAESIQQLPGFSLAANALDAKQVSRAVKDYNGAVSAIREIFGDNGNPNAPIQTLIANLRHLTNGAQGSMGPGQVESLVREIRLAARDSNTDLQNLNALMAQKKAQAMQLGLSETTAERGMVGDLIRGQTMQDLGLFKPGVGKLNKAEAENTASALATRGDSSSIGFALGALNRIAQESPEMFQGTEFAAAMEAYRSGRETYDYNGQTKNLAKLAGRTNPAGLLAFAQAASGGKLTAERFGSTMSDRINTEPHIRAGYAFNAQFHDVGRQIAMANTLNIDEGLKANQASLGLSDDMRATITRGLGQDLADISLSREALDKTPAERAQLLATRGRERLTKFFMSDGGGKLSERAAKAKADQVFSSVFGDTAEKRQNALFSAQNRMETVSQQMTGRGTAANIQLYVGERETNVRTEVNRRRAQRFADAGLGSMSTPFQRFGEELDRMATGDMPTLMESMKRIFDIKSEDEMSQSFAPEMRAGLVELAKLQTQSSVTKKQIEQLAEAAQKNPAGPEAKKLLEFAGKPSDTVITPENVADITAIARMQMEDTEAGSTPAERQKNKAQRERVNIITRGIDTGKAEDVKAGAKAMARQVLGDSASDKQIEEFASAALSADKTTFEEKIARAWDGWRGLSDDKKSFARDVSQTLRTAQEIGGAQAVGIDRAAKETAEAQTRRTAQVNRAVDAVSKPLAETIAEKLDTGRYEQLRPKGMTDAQFETRKKDRISKISTAFAETAVQYGDALAGKSETNRTLTFMDLTVQNLAKQLRRENPVMTEDESVAEAKKELNAAVGGSEKDTTRRINYVIDQANKARKEYIPNTGIPTAAKTMTAEQKALAEELGKDPTGKALETAFRDADKRKHLLTMPDEDAVALFNKLSPEARAKSMENMASLARAGDVAGFKITPDDVANMRRIGAAITESHANAAGGVSSNNLNPAAIAALQQQMLQETTGGMTAPGSGSGVGLAQQPAEPGTTHTVSTAAALAEIDAEVAQIDARNKRNWFGYNKGDDERRQHLMATRQTLEFKRGYRTKDGKPISLDGSKTPDALTVHDPYNAYGKTAGRSFTLREVEGKGSRYGQMGPDAAERVFIPYDLGYTEEQAQQDVEQYGTAAEKAAFKKSGAKKVNVTLPDGTIRQVIEKPHSRLIAERALHDMKVAAAHPDDPHAVERLAHEQLEALKQKRRFVSEGAFVFDDEKRADGTTGESGDRLLARYNYLQHTLQSAAQQRQPAEAGKLDITGVLRLNGLAEVILSAFGNRMENTPDFGASVDMAPGGGANVGN